MAWSCSNSAPPCPPAGWGRRCWINHSIAFSDDGACTNQAESYFPRLRRAEWGQHHHISGRYLGAYAREMAWREDTRRKANGMLHTLVTGAALAHPVSRM